jgi:predicted 2-oxoglutarate/Fe(II)-dependent dioxygenase YbiX
VIYHLKQVLTADELSQLREIATRVRWDDGRKTAGVIAAPHKHNTEAPHDSREAQAAAEITQLYTYYYNLIRMWATP